MGIFYSDRKTEVKLGDRVWLRLWFRKRFGRVVYVPGSSEFNPEFEYRGMKWVGIRIQNGALVATPVFSSTGALKRKIIFTARDSSPCELITADSREFDEQDEGPAF